METFEIIIQTGSFGLIVYLVIFYTKKLSQVIETNTAVLYETREAIKELKKKIEEF